MFWHGCNYPWSTDGSVVYYGLDFGANVWGSHLGVSTRRAAVARDFDAMAALGFTVVRWFVFADGRSGLVYDERGIPESLDPHVFGDLDAALDIARGAGIRLVLVLLDHRWMFEGVRETIADPATDVLLEARLPHGRAHVLRSREGRAALVERVVDPLVRRYGRGGHREDLGPAILAWELMNEPDFVIEEWERDVSPHVPRPLPFEAMSDMVTRLSDLVHGSSSALTTIAAARLRNLWAWDDQALGLDFLQIHSYPDARHPERDPDISDMAASRLGVSRPIVIGEFPGTLDAYLRFAVGAGYAGAWPWSFSGTDAYGRLPVEPLRQFAARHPELVNPRARSG